MLTTHTKPRLLAVVLLLIMVAVLIPACGKKGPPIPPHQAPALRVTDLAAELLSATVVLRWTQPAGHDRPSGYWIYRAATALDDGCSGCPLLFQKEGAVTASPGQTVFQFSNSVRVGFRYTFKVKPYFTLGAPGPDSNDVSVTVAP